MRTVLVHPQMMTKNASGIVRVNTCSSERRMTSWRHRFIGIADRAESPLFERC